jgi:hypothetical protein
LLAAGLIRDELQALLALARVGEQPSSSTPTSLPVRTMTDSYEPATGCVGPSGSSRRSGSRPWARDFIACVRRIVKSGIGRSSRAGRRVENPAAVRRLLTASGNPELRTVVAIAQALGAEVRIVPKTRARGTGGAGRRGARTAA